MAQEGPHYDLKEAFDPSSKKALLDLVKDVIAIANSGGGKLTYGRSEIAVVGLHDEACEALDSKRVADQVEKYVPGLGPSLSHDVQEPLPGRRVLILTIESAPTPIVISKNGSWIPPDSKAEELVFRKGDIWVRHGTRNERATQEDLRTWLDSARSQERSTIFERMAMVMDLPEGSTLEVVTKSGAHIDTPSDLISSARHRRRWDPDHLLSGEDLLWIFSHRAALKLSDDDLRILISSALRKSATLYYWIALAEHSPELIVSELNAVLSAEDRDKSDAGPNVAELAAFYADNGDVKRIIDALKGSEYKHFREAVSQWGGRVKAKARLARRMSLASHDGTQLGEYTLEQLEELADKLSASLRNKMTSATARRLSEVNREIWARKTGRTRE